MKWKQTSPASASWLTNTTMSYQNIYVIWGVWQKERGAASVFFLGDEASFFRQKNRK